MDWDVNEARDYGRSCGMAFQVYDDLTDLLKAVGQRWEATASGPLESLSENSSGLPARWIPADAFAATGGVSRLGRTYAID